MIILEQVYYRCNTIIGSIKSFDLANNKKKILKKYIDLLQKKYIIHLALSLSDISNFLYLQIVQVLLHLQSNIYYLNPLVKKNWIIIIIF